MNSITREQAEERLSKSDIVFGTSIKYCLDILFPPPFIPKAGEVIAVSDEPGDDIREWHYREFVEMKGDRYMCRSTMSGGNTWWLHTRPLTDKERRI